jgi:hypothetical protein
MRRKKRTEMRNYSKKNWISVRCAFTQRGKYKKICNRAFRSRSFVSSVYKIPAPIRTGPSGFRTASISYLLENQEKIGI